MAYITDTILSLTLGASKIDDLTDGGDAAVLAQLIALASADVESALQVGGYAAAVPASVYDSTASDCPSVIKLAAIGAFTQLAYGRNDLEIPEAFRTYLGKLASLRNGEIEIPGVSVNTARAVGGIVSSDSSSTSSNIDAKPPIFAKRSAWRTF